MTSDDTQPRGKFTRDIALGVLIGGAGIILVLGIALMLKSDAATKAQVFHALVPLVASWVGTVIAYYFSKENFDAATSSVTNMARLSMTQKLQSIPVTDKMLERTRIVTYDKHGPALESAKLSELVAFATRRNVKRLPLFTDRGAIQYIVHVSMVHEFISRKVLEQVPQPADLTFGDLLKDPALKALFENSKALVAQSATLADAKDAMDATPNCEDVFVTASGKADEPVRGWLTSDMLMEAAKV